MDQGLQIKNIRHNYWDKEKDKKIKVKMRDRKRVKKTHENIQVIRQMT